MSEKTEEKIKAAARKIFRTKGFAATRTRDIAEEAGVNLALLNYYFKSKQDLYNEIMSETLKQFAATIMGTANNPDLSIEERIDRLINNYFDKFIEEPEIPLFVINIVNSPDIESFINRIGIKGLFKSTLLYKQMAEGCEKKDKDIRQMLINLMGLAVAPFFAKPILRVLFEEDQEDFTRMINERRKLIPIWIKAILDT
ncbi:MAG: TetR/AcrR family transcriptional regulator [Bacteroidales bacterium]